MRRQGNSIGISEFLSNFCEKFWHSFKLNEAENEVVSISLKAWQGIRSDGTHALVTKGVTVWGSFTLAPLGETFIGGFHQTFSACS